MAEYWIQGKTLDEIAHAINEKGGWQNIYRADEMAEAIESIPSGGGSLPSVITKIDGGVFTPVNDITGMSFWISHNLGVVPKGVIIWTDDNDLRTLTAEVAQRYLLCSNIQIIEWITGTTDSGAIPNHLYRGTSGGTSTTGSPVPQSGLSNYFTATRFNNGAASVYYKAGVQYKWITWA